MINLLNERPAENKKKYSKMYKKHNAINTNHRNPSQIKQEKIFNEISFRKPHPFPNINPNNIFSNVLFGAIMIILMEN